MKNKLKNGMLIFSFTVLLCMTALIASCANSEIKSINIRWNLNLSTSMDIVYSYSDVGWFGDGVYYYVCDVEKDALQINFTSNNYEIEEIVTYYSGFLDEIDSTYFIDFDHNLSSYYQTENETNDVICLIYDNTLSQLIILEIHT